MNPRILLAALLLLIFLPAAQAQHFDVNPITGEIPCATMQDDSMLRAAHPEMGTLDEVERWLQRQIAREQSQVIARQDTDLYTIPTVVHIIHNGEQVGSGLNLSAARIADQFQVLNDDFRRKVGTRGFNDDSVGADTGIEFCPAYTDPQGLVMAERGITRHSLADLGLTELTNGFGTINNVIKRNTIWDPQRYFNIWVVPGISGGSSGIILGYATFPAGSGLPGLGGGTSPLNDGIVVITSNFGGEAIGGRTATHEVGHWLGLRHIWGDGPCGTDDYCADTPESDDSNFGCAVNHVSCGTVDMVANYMDYSDDQCQNIFTQDQRTRMRTALRNAVRRSELLTSTVCQLPTAAPAADFEMDTSTYCGGMVQFFDRSSNLPTDWSWFFSHGVVSAERNPIVFFDAPGTYQVQLVANNFLGLDVVSRTVTIDIPTSDPEIVASADQTIFRGDTVQISAQGGAQTYRWLPELDIVNPILPLTFIYPDSSRTYYVYADFVGECIDVDSTRITVLDNPTSNGSASSALATRIQLPRPNPASQSVAFAADFEQGGRLSLSLRDLQGRQLLSLVDQTVAAGRFAFTWQRDQRLAAGVYLLVWEVAGVRHVQRLQLR